MSEHLQPAQRRKPIGQKSYGSIPHLIGSRRGPMDQGVNEGQQRICCERVRSRHDTIIVQEKLDGSNVGAARIGDDIVALTRSGILASQSEFVQHHAWAAWVQANRERFLQVLEDGERLCGEWLALAHGTIYNLPHEPLVAFDIMRGSERLPFEPLRERLQNRFVMPHLLHVGGPLPIERALELVEPSAHGVVGLAEGAVWRVERFDPKRKKVVVDFLAKYVRPEKEDGKYLPTLGHPERPFIWLWQPPASVENSGGEDAFLAPGAGHPG